MSLNIKEAFLYPFGDREWKTKLVIPALIAALPAIYKVTQQELDIIPRIFFTFIIAVLSLLYFGFILEYMRNQLNETNINKLPNIVADYKKFIINAIKCILVCAVYTLLLIIPSALVFFGFKVGTNVFFISILMACILIFLYFLILFYAQLVFIENYSFEEALNISKIFKLIISSKWLTLSTFLIINCTSGVFSVLELLLKRFVISIIPLACIETICSLFIVSISVQTYKLTKKNLKTEVIAQS